jgi:hypothetical protein
MLGVGQGKENLEKMRGIVVQGSNVADLEVKPSSSTSDKPIIV